MDSSVGTRHRIGLAIALAVLVTACGGGDDDVADGSIDPSGNTAAEPVETDPLFVRTTGDGDSDAATVDSVDDDSQAPVGAAPESTTTTVAATIPLVSDTGVPGIDSDDAFCQAWSQFAGSFRAIGLVSAIRDVDAGLRLEVIASGAVLDAISGMGEHLPAELEPEREVLLDDFAGPFGRRAAKAGESLATAGLSADGVGLLTDAWLTTLAEIGLDDPSLDVAIPDAVDAAVFDAAFAEFAAATPAIGDDPSLTTFTEIPLTDAYTLASCPDAGTLSGNDDL